LASELASVARASEWLRGLGPESGLGEDDVYRLDLCASELLTNIVSYAYEGEGRHEIELAARVLPGEVHVEIVDDGIAFDPTASRAAPDAVVMEDAPVGGWGLRLVRRFADECRYQRLAGRNRLAFSIRRGTPIEADEAGRRPRGPERRRVESAAFPLTRADGKVVASDERVGRDRRLLGFISRFELFRGIPFGLVEKAIAGCRIQRLEDGAVLLRPGERNDAVAFVISGRLRVHLDSPESQNFFVIGMGDCVGELSAIDEKPVSAFVVADAGCRILRVPGDTLFGPVLAIPEVARRFMAVLTERLRRASDRLLAQQRAALEFAQLQRDLRHAHDIQLGMLPQEAVFFPDRPEVDVAAGIRVAREVGGDLYDAWFIDPTHLFFMIGDVCGKGLPAALFMVRTVTLLRSEVTRRGMTKTHLLRKMMDRVNAHLVERNEASLFVTLFCAVLDVTTGELSYVNAGHCPPAIAPPAGAFTPLVEPRNPVAGIVEGVTFHAGEMKLAPGTTIVLYTDGVTEAESPALEEFGIDRFLATLDGAPRGASSLVESTLGAVQAFAGTQPQSDDIALMITRYRGPA
jgi:serine phosphatase RsbU (regulator of sigma subunit)/anti-sigma regulatory factor (Ser/Thr protein kinase)